MSNKSVCFVTFAIALIFIYQVPSSSLRVGDIVVVHKDERVPADMILLKTREESGEIFIRTDQLDGETDWKLRHALHSTKVWVLL